MNSQIQVPQLTKVNKFIIASYVGLFILSNILSKSSGVSLASLMGLSYSGVSSGNIFQFLTFPFVDSNFTGVLFNSILIWFIGSELESKWGMKFYIKFLAISTYSAGIFFILLSLVVGRSVAVMPLYGPAGTVLALILAYGVIYSERVMLFMMIFPMKAKYFCMILGGIEIFMAMFSNHSNAAWSHLIAMLSAYLFLKYKSYQAQGVTFKSIKEHRHRAKMKSKLSLVEEDEVDNAPKKHDPDKPKYWQ
jgi:membrane associated rhomboid family serine protease